MMRDYLKLDIPKEKIWFTSDLHFGHRNIMRFCHRPFDTTDEMDQKLIENWNSVVKEDDIVFDLGDFCYGSTGTWKKILSQLNGKHYLIKGNHDESRAPQQSAWDMFEDVRREMIIKVDDQIIGLNHYPYLCFAGTYRNNNPPIQLFGHVHLNSKKEYNTGLDFERLKMLFPTQYEVGVDFHNYFPVSYVDVMRRIEYQRTHNTNCLCWIN